jgi:hypothetical protein
MQWTVDQITAELGALDAQLLSYFTRASMEPNADAVKCERLHDWVKAHSELLVTILTEMHPHFMALHRRIECEQTDYERRQPFTKAGRETRYRHADA